MWCTVIFYAHRVALCNAVSPHEVRWGGRTSRRAGPCSAPTTPAAVDPFFLAVCTGPERLPDLACHGERTDPCRISHWCAGAGHRSSAAPLACSGGAVGPDPCGEDTPWSALNDGGRRGDLSGGQPSCGTGREEGGGQGRRHGHAGLPAPGAPLLPVYMRRASTSSFRRTTGCTSASPTTPSSPRRTRATAEEYDSARRRRSHGADLQSGGRV